MYFKKIRLTIIMASSLCLLNVSPVFAMQNSPTAEQAVSSANIIRRMQNILSANTYLSIDANGKATTMTRIIGYEGVTTSIHVTVSLQQYKYGSWKTIQTYSKTVNSDHLTLIENRTVSRGYSYRTVATINAYAGSSVETRTVVSLIKKY